MRSHVTLLHNFCVKIFSLAFQKKKLSDQGPTGQFLIINYKVGYTDSVLLKLVGYDYDCSLNW